MMNPIGYEVVTRHRERTLRRDAETTRRLVQHRSDHRDQDVSTPRRPDRKGR